ncbi:MAG: hypothetical protein ACTH3G_01130 [Citricoccus sp.]
MEKSEVTSVYVPWLPVVGFLEQLEFHPANDSSLRHPGRWIAGSLLVGVVLILVTVMKLWPFGVSELDAGLAVLFHVLPFIAAFAFWLSSLSAKTLSRIFRKTEQWLGVVDVWARVLLTVFSVFVGACFVAAVVEFWGTNWPIIAAFGFYLLIAPVASQALGIELRIGVVAPQSRMRAATVARWTRTIQLGVILAAVVAVIAQTGWVEGAVISLSVTLLAALVGFHRRQVAHLESAVSEFVDLLEAIRAGALSVDHDRHQEWTRGVFSAVRVLQIRLSVRPGVLAPLIRSRSLLALCRLVDAQATCREYLGTGYLVGQHVRAGEALLGLDRGELALGTAQVADALIQQLAPSSGPADHPAGADVRQILQKSAIPPASITPAHSETMSSVPASTSPEATSATVV